MIGKQAGFVQAGHGKRTPLQKLDRGDLMVFYSPKTSLKNGTSLQSFTAIAQMKDDKIYQVEMKEDFHPYRRDAQYLKCEECPIRPLIEHLEFIENKKSWGFQFRFGLFEINRHDFALICSIMKAEIPSEAGVIPRPSTF